MKIYAMDDKYRQYTFDESRLTGHCDSISFPESEAEVLEILAEMQAKNVPITIQGGLTGVAGGAVPFGGHVMNLSHMNHVLDYQADEQGAVITVEPGLTLMDLHKEIVRLAGKAGLFWPPEPTASTATVGGIAANNSCGICAYHYGESRKYFDFVRLACADGTVRTITAAEEPELLCRVLGAEGAAGVFTALGLRLIQKPESIWGICFFLKTEEELFRFVEGARQIAEEGTDGAAVAAIEFMDADTIALILEQKSTMARLKELPEIPDGCVGAVYLELHGGDDPIEELAGALLELSAECGCDEEDTWAMSGEADVEKLREFRYSASEIVNTRIDTLRRDLPELTKLAADMTFSGEDFAATYTRYKTGAAAIGVRCCVYGHAGENACYANLLPETEEAYAQAKALLRSWAEDCRAQDGVTVGEYGVGKLMKELLSGLLPEKKLETVSALTAEFDPRCVWNPGNVL